MRRRAALAAALLGPRPPLWMASSASRHGAVASFDLATATIADMQAAMDAGALTVRTARPALSESHRRLRPEGPGAELADHRELGSARDGARARRASARPTGRAARCTASRSSRRISSTRPDMQTTGGFIVMKGAVPAHDANVISEAARGRRDRAREDQHERLARPVARRRRQLDRRPSRESLRPDAHRGAVEQRHRRRRWPRGSPRAASAARPAPRSATRRRTARSWASRRRKD